MPSHRSTRIRLVAALPLEVAFKSITYRLAIAQVPVSGMWQLEARWAGGYWLCAHDGSEAKLRKMLFKTGVEFERATVAHTIFGRLVTEGRAEVVIEVQ
jgi:hypothetical protein